MPHATTRTCMSSSTTALGRLPHATCYMLHATPRRPVSHTGGRARLISFRNNTRRPRDHCPSNGGCEYRLLRLSLASHPCPLPANRPIYHQRRRFIGPCSSSLSHALAASGLHIHLLRIVQQLDVNLADLHPTCCVISMLTFTASST